MHAKRYLNNSNMLLNMFQKLPKYALNIEKCHKKYILNLDFQKYWFFKKENKMFNRYFGRKKKKNHYTRYF